MIVLAVLGLVLPGYLLARALRVPAPWGAAMPLSALLLTEWVVVYALLGMPVRFCTIGIPVLVITVVAAAFVRRRTSGPALPSQVATTQPNRISRALQVVVVL